ncbi:hypothetical protein ACOSP7_005274 [Xanthoceras sorbifolium]
MGSHMNFKNYGDPHRGEAKPPGNHPLARQPSVYSLTFEEFQNTWGGIGKDLGSMNMDELLKNIWTAEETQAMTSSTSVINGEGNVPGGNLQRQGSLTLPRTLSQKTVDEVWKDLIKESGGGAKEVSSSGGGGGGGSNMPQRQPTLGEITLEEFLVRAGVVREDAQQISGMTDNGVFYANDNNNSLALGFQQPSRNNGLMGNRLMQNNSSVPGQPPALALNVGGLRSTQQPQQQPQQHRYQQQQQLQQHPYQPQQQQQYQPQQQQQQRQQYQPQQQQPLFPKQATVAFAPRMNLVNSTQLNSPGARGAVVTVANPSMNNNLVQAGGLQTGGMGMVGLGTGGVTVASGSPASQVSPDMIAKSSADTSSSPVPYVFSRGRKSGALEKVVERRHRRMIKNRESAARSRARKQAYTLELEAEVAKLKELNQELQRKQAETVEMQKNQIMEKMRQQWGGKRHCLRRTLTGPW